MEKDHNKQSHWITLAPGMAIQALLAERDGEQRVYVVTEEPHLGARLFKRDLEVCASGFRNTLQRFYRCVVCSTLKACNQ